jgi:hypothetical protein
MQTSWYQGSLRGSPLGDYWSSTPRTPSHRVLSFTSPHRVLSFSSPHRVLLLTSPIRVLSLVSHSSSFTRFSPSSSFAHFSPSSSFARFSPSSSFLIELFVHCYHGLFVRFWSLHCVGQHDLRHCVSPDLDVG